MFDQVLWPECGWQSVSLTDLITGASVKKFYRKATLCIHPDKVQQKGATLQQKYIAEKVFDLLKVLVSLIDLVFLWSSDSDFCFNACYFELILESNTLPFLFSGLYSLLIMLLVEKLLLYLMW